MHEKNHDFMNNYVAREHHLKFKFNFRYTLSFHENKKALANFSTVTEMQIDIFFLFTKLILYSSI